MEATAESKKAKLFRCKICGEPYVGIEPPGRCPFCGAYHSFIVDAKDYKETFDVELNEKDKMNVEKALQLEISNSAFYFCAAEKDENDWGKQLFRALGKVEAEHASIWRKILKLDKITIPKSSECSLSDTDNLKESHHREEMAIEFYKQAAKDSTNLRIRMLFGAIVQVEQDHLHLSGVRLGME